jgi:polar amino acid transport system permease protein
VHTLFRQFFNWHHFTKSLPLILKGFKTNVSLFMIAEVFVLVWAMVLALMRRATGRALLPVRWFAIAYIDFWRGLPAIVAIYLIGYGLPFTSIPVVSHWNIFRLGVLALTLLYGAYVAEVYRAGIESVHWSQSAAARSLGLSQGKTMRHVVLPQAVKRVIPPLLNDFIALQKDTALVGLLGLPEAFSKTRVYAGQHFNATPYVGLGLSFVVITIPLTRYVDYMIKRDQRRTQAGMSK